MNQAKLYTLIKSQIVSEKSSVLSQFKQTFVFKVDSSANKRELKQAFELAFGVNVVSIQVVNQKGKVKRFKGRLGKQAGYKKAYVRLPEGQTIDISA